MTDRLLPSADDDTFCAYCGMKYPRGTPKFDNPALTAHIKVCPKHPMRLAEVELERLRGVEKAAQALLADVHRRYPGEVLRCPFMQALEDALNDKGEADLFQEILCPTVE